MLLIYVYRRETNLNWSLINLISTYSKKCITSDWICLPPTVYSLYHDNDIDDSDEDESSDKIKKSCKPKPKKILVKRWKNVLEGGQFVRKEVEELEEEDDEEEEEDEKHMNSTEEKNLFALNNPPESVKKHIHRELIFLKYERFVSNALSELDVGTRMDHECDKVFDQYALASTRFWSERLMRQYGPQFLLIKTGTKSAWFSTTLASWKIHPYYWNHQF